jgi:hypothetical protein
MNNQRLFLLASVTLGAISLGLSCAPLMAGGSDLPTGMVNFNDFNMNGVDPGAITIPGSGNGGSVTVNGADFASQTLLGYQNDQFMWNNNQNNNNSVLTNVMNNTQLGTSDDREWAPPSISVTQIGNSFSGGCDMMMDCDPAFKEAHSITSGSGKINADTTITSTNADSTLTASLDSHVDVNIANDHSGDITTGVSGGNASLMNVSGVNVGNNVNNTATVNLNTISLNLGGLF